MAWNSRRSFFSKNFNAIDRELYDFFLFEEKLQKFFPFVAELSICIQDFFSSNFELF